MLLSLTVTISITSNFNKVNAEEFPENATIEHSRCYDLNMNPCDEAFSISEEDLTFYEDNDWIANLFTLYPDLNSESMIHMEPVRSLAPTQKLVSVTRFHAYPTTAPNSIYYNKDGHFGYIPKTAYYPSPKYPFWIVITRE